MSNCHDTYEWTEEQGKGVSQSKPAALSALPCHDSYPANGSAPVPLPRPEWHPSYPKVPRVHIVAAQGTMDLATRRKLWDMMNDGEAPDVVVDLCQAVPDLAGAVRIASTKEEALRSFTPLRLHHGLAS